MFLVLKHFFLSLLWSCQQPLGSETIHPLWAQNRGTLEFLQNPGQLQTRVYYLQLDWSGLGRLEADFLMSPNLTLEKVTQRLHDEASQECMTCAPVKPPAASPDKREASILVLQVAQKIGPNLFYYLVTMDSQTENSMRTGIVFTTASPAYELGSGTLMRLINVCYVD